MNKWAKVILLSLFVASCRQTGPSLEFYVLIDPRETEQLASALKVAAEGAGLKAWSDTISDRHGLTLTTLEAEKGPTRVWAQNVPFNSLEDRRCGPLGDAGIDPGQFVVSVSSTFSFSSEPTAKATYQIMKRDLVRRGYKVRDRPLACSLVAKQN